MKDKIITKTIPKIQNNLLLFLGALFFVGFLTFIALIEGIHIAALKLGNVKIEQLYLKWDHKLHIKASLIHINDTDDDEPINLEKLSSLPDWIRIARQWIDSVEIDSIRYGDTKIELKYDGSTHNLFVLDFKDFHCQNYFTLSPTSLYMRSVTCKNVSNEMFLDLKHKKLNGTLELTLPDTPKLLIKYHGDTTKIAFDGKFHDKLHSLKMIADFLHADPEVMPWITTAMRFDSLEVDHLTASLIFSDSQSFLKTLRAKGSFTHASYQFDRDIAPITSSRVAVSFINSKLWIYPAGGQFYALPTEKSHLNIDFGQKNIILNAFIQTDKAILNDDILSLLKHYDITVPIKQIEGRCNVDLNLSINLNTNETHADGLFMPSASTLLLDTLTLSTTHGKVSLKDSMVTFEGFNADYMGLANGKVKGFYNATHETGTVSIQLQSIRPIPENKDFYLLAGQNPLQVEYQISPKLDSLKVAPSKWHFLGEELNVNGFVVPYNFHQGIMQIPRLKFSIANKMAGQLSGDINTLKHTANFDLNIDSIQIPPFKLMDRSLSIQAKFDHNHIRLLTTQPSNWNVNQIPLKLSKVEASLDNDLLIFNNIDFMSDSILNGSVSSRYNISKRSGDITFTSLRYVEPNLHPILKTDSDLSFDLLFKNNNIELYSRALDTSFKTELDGWKIEVADISRISRHSPILRYYNIHDGHINVFYGGKNTQYVFNGELLYPYKLMEINNESLSKYKFFGTFKDGNTNVRINDRIVLNHDDSTRIRGRNVGINVIELARFLSDHQTGKEPTVSPSSQKIYIDLKDSRLYINQNHKIIADSIEAVSMGGRFSALLQHRQGIAKFAMEKENFYIDGNGFNDQFMEQLFNYSDLSGGNLSFQSKGTLETFDGIVKVENSTLKKHKVLNNVLAFINTVPSLATFSLPNYNSNGLPLQEAYSQFSYSNGTLKMDHFTLMSPEIKIYGKGSANIPKDTIHGTMTLKTDLGSKLSKVPMVGYILFGKDGSVSTTLTIEGKLSDPKIETAFAKEILTAPFNILKRTAIYPFLWMMDDEK